MGKGQIFHRFWDDFGVSGGPHSRRFGADVGSFSMFLTIEFLGALCLSLLVPKGSKSHEK